MDKYLFSNDLVQANRIIYTPSLFARESLLYLQETGELQALSPHISQRKSLDSYLFFIVLEGSGTLVYEDKTFVLSKKDCVFIDCQKPYWQSSSTNLWKLKWVHFNGPFVRPLYLKYIERGGQPVFCTRQEEAYEEVLDTILETARSNDHVKDMLLNENLNHLMTLLMKDSWHPEHRQVSSKYDLSDIKKFIDEHTSQKISLEDLASRFYINKFYLTRIFKERYGMTINAYINQNKITLAKQELRFSTWPIETIGRHVGIDDPNYFSRLFKKIEGMSPGQYRKMWTSSMDH